MMQSKIRTDLVIQLVPWIDQFVNRIPYLEKESRRDYRKTLLSFITYMERNLARKSSPTMIKQETIAGWLKEMTARCCLQTVVSRVGTITRFLSFLEKNGVLQENPLARLQKQYPKRGFRGIVLALVGSSPQKSLQALKLPSRFSSPLGLHMQKFIALGRSQGKIYRAEEYILCSFDRFLGSYSDPPRQLSDSILRQWLNLFSRHRPGTLYQNFAVIRQFCLYLRRFDPNAYVPGPSLTPSLPPPFLPHIYSRTELVAILKAARQLKPSTWAPLRPQILYLLILLLYTTGIRLGEVLKLQLGDIDWENQSLYIRETKFFKSRSVPLSPSMMKELGDYLQLRQQSGAPTNPESPLFWNPHRQGPHSRAVIQKPFRRMLQRLGLKPTRGRSGPRLHDMRHSFAVHRLEDWYRRGVDVQSRLGLLSTYLGHGRVASTQRYLTMTTELLQQASQRFNQYSISNKHEENQNEK